MLNWQIKGYKHYKCYAFLLIGLTLVFDKTYTEYTHQSPERLWTKFCYHISEFHLVKMFTGEFLLVCIAVVLCHFQESSSKSLSLIQLV